MLPINLQSKLIRLGLDLSHTLDVRRKHFTFILLRNKILSVGWNHNRKTNPISVNHRFSKIHSEIHALTKFRDNKAVLKKCSMVNIRLLCNGSLALSKPCEDCQKELNNYVFKCIWFTDTFGRFLKLE